MKSAPGAPTDDDLNKLWQSVRELLSSKDRDSFDGECAKENLKASGRPPAGAMPLKSLSKVLAKYKSFTAKTTDAELKALCKALEIIVDEKKELISYTQLCDAVQGRGSKIRRGVFPKEEEKQEAVSPLKASERRKAEETKKKEEEEQKKKAEEQKRQKELEEKKKAEEAAKKR